MDGRKNVILPGNGNGNVLGKMAVELILEKQQGLARDTGGTTL